VADCFRETNKESTQKPPGFAIAFLPFGFRLEKPTTDSDANTY